MLKINDHVLIVGCRHMAIPHQVGRVMRITPTGRITVAVSDGILKFDRIGLQLGREYPDYALSGGIDASPVPIPVQE